MNEVIVDGSRLRIRYADGSETSLSKLWLRDNCRCTSCRIVATGEHRYFVGDHATLPDATHAEIADGALSVSWTDGHTTMFTQDDLESITKTSQRRHQTPQLWADEFDPPRLSWSAVTTDHQSRLEFFEAFMVHGAVIVTGTPTQSGECIRFLEHLELPIRDTPFDRLHDVFFRADGYNVAHTDEPLPPHNDFASYQWPPSGQILHFLINEVQGGDSILVDGFKAVARLAQQDPGAVEVLASIPVAFREHSDTAESWARAPLIRQDSHGTVTGLRFSNQLMQPLPPDQPLLDEWYQAYHGLARIIADPKNQVRFRSEPGDMQVLHAHRMLHARHGFDGTSGNRHLQDTYFEYDDLAARAALDAGDL